MPVTANLPGYRWFDFLKDAATRVGIYIGVCLSLIFTVWFLVANRVHFLEPLALERNLIAAGLIAFFAAVPLFRFYRSPAELLGSGLIAWSILAITYRVFAFFFSVLEENYSTFHVFVMGAVSYLVFATLSWVGTIIWRVRATDSSHTHH